MTKYLRHIIVLTSVVLIGCNFSNLQIKGEMGKLQGSWVNQEDTKWVLTFEKDEFFDSYEDEKENCKYKITDVSCDSDYTDEKGTFINYYCKYDFCCEIIGLTDSIFSYRETNSGKNHVFLKVDQ